MERTVTTTAPKWGEKIETNSPASRKQKLHHRPSPKQNSHRLNNNRNSPAKELVELWKQSPAIHELLKASASPEEARENLYGYLEAREREILLGKLDVPLLETAAMRQAIAVLRSVLGPVNEAKTRYSSLQALRSLAHGVADDGVLRPQVGFIKEFQHLFRGVEGCTLLYRKVDAVVGAQENQTRAPRFTTMRGRSAALERSHSLDNLARKMETATERFHWGLDEGVAKQRHHNASHILNCLGGSWDDWADPEWHTSNVIRDPDVLAQLVTLTDEEYEAIRIARKEGIPFGLTPYYCSLMSPDPHDYSTVAIRAQVLPPLDYVNKVKARKKDERGGKCKISALDFMGEHDTSPVDLVTRRYPSIAIFKPYNTCAQICVYCQRNWEIEDVLEEGALAPTAKIQAAIDWLERTEAIQDVLLTGGDPLALGDDKVDWILGMLSRIPHIKRIRIGSRMPVVLPCRLNDDLVSIFEKYHEPGRRELALVTHFQHCSEITPEVVEAIQKVRRLGMGTYNQQVFTLYNSRRFETCALRRALRLAGIDPYYLFNAKGKEETRTYKAPIARLLQEVKEEARLMPGLSRTEEPVFNVPRLGKNHLRAAQDHRVVGIKADGARVYEFHPWEKNMQPIPPYYYTDIPIESYLQQLEQMGESPVDYESIFYYY